MEFARFCPAGLAGAPWSLERGLSVQAVDTCGKATRQVKNKAMRNRTVYTNQTAGFLEAAGRTRTGDAKSTNSCALPTELQRHEWGGRLDAATPPGGRRWRMEGASTLLPSHKKIERSRFLRFYFIYGNFSPPPIAKNLFCAFCIQKSCSLPCKFP